MANGANLKAEIISGNGSNENVINGGGLSRKSMKIM
jgi:hypothetical protein